MLFSAQERWLALPCVVVLAGCAAFEPKPLVPAQTAGKFEARTLADPALQTFVEANAPELAKEWPRRSWDLPGGELEDALQIPFKAPSVAQPQRDTGDT